MTENTDQLVRTIRVAITGGTGFVGTALARRLLDEGHAVTLIARRHRENLPAGADLALVGLDEPAPLRRAFEGCAFVAHLAGINRERGRQTYRRVHVDGTTNVVAAARQAGVERIAMLSFLRARPDCGSAYHESKYQAEQIVRTSGLPHAIVKSGVIWGRGDHLLDHISHALFTLPVFATVGWRQQPLRPVAVGDVVEILRASLIQRRMTNKTIAVVGPEQLTLRQVVNRVARASNRRVLIIPMPVVMHRILAITAEQVMDVPLVSRAQVRMLVEGLCEPSGSVDPLPSDLAPRTRFTEDLIRGELPAPGPFTIHDLKLSCNSE